MDKPLAELAACFQSKSRLPDQALVQLTEAARAAAAGGTTSPPPAASRPTKT
jgi:hypothetical protein